jgi:hypothetical protein
MNELSFPIFCDTVVSKSKYFGGVLLCLTKPLNHDQAVIITEDSLGCLFTRGTDSVTLLNKHACWRWQLGYNCLVINYDIWSAISLFQSEHV